MQQEEFDKYISERFENQKKWYNDRAMLNKKRHMLTRRAIIILSAATPVLITVSHWSTYPLMNYIFAALSIVASALIAVASSFADSFRYHEDWIQKRKANEKLKREFFHFETRIGAYKGLSLQEAQFHFVERVENIIDEDTNLFVQGEYKAEKQFKQNLEQRLDDAQKKRSQLNQPAPPADEKNENPKP